MSSRRERFMRTSEIISTENALARAYGLDRQARVSVIALAVLVRRLGLRVAEIPGDGDTQLLKMQYRTSRATFQQPRMFRQCIGTNWNSLPLS